MTPEEYRGKFGADLKAHQNQPWFVAMMQVIAAQHPARQSPEIGLKDLNERLNGSIAYFNEIIGYEKLSRLIHSLSDMPPKPKPESPDDYAEPEKI